MEGQRKMMSPGDILRLLRQEHRLLIESVRTQPAVGELVRQFIRNELPKRFRIRSPEVEILGYVDGRIAVPSDGERFLILILAEVRIQGAKSDTETPKTRHVHFRAMAHVNGTAVRTAIRYENFDFSNPEYSDLKLSDIAEE